MESFKLEHFKIFCSHKKAQKKRLPYNPVPGKKVLDPRKFQYNIHGYLYDPVSERGYGGVFFLCLFVAKKHSNRKSGYAINYNALAQIIGKISQLLLTANPRSLNANLHQPPASLENTENHGGLSSGEGMPRAPEEPRFAASPSERIRKCAFWESSVWLRQIGVDSGARRSMPPSAWLRATPCPPAKRVVKKKDPQPTTNLPRGMRG